MAGSDWMHDAACMNHPTIDWFDDEHYQSAAATCDSCPVRPDCLEYAVSNSIDDGVWGGLVPFQLRKGIAARRRTAGRRAPVKRPGGRGVPHGRG